MLLVLLLQVHQALLLQDLLVLLLLQVPLGLLGSFVEGQFVSVGWWKGVVRLVREGFGLEREV